MDTMGDIDALLDSGLVALGDLKTLRDTVSLKSVEAGRVSNLANMFGSLGQQADGITRLNQSLNTVLESPAQSEAGDIGETSDRDEEVEYDLSAEGGDMIVVKSKGGAIIKKGDEMSEEDVGFQGLVLEDTDNPPQKIDWNAVVNKGAANVHQGSTDKSKGGASYTDPKLIPASQKESLSSYTTATQDAPLSPPSEGNKDAGAGSARDTVKDAGSMEGSGVKGDDDADGGKPPKTAPRGKQGKSGSKTGTQTKTKSTNQDFTTITSNDPNHKKNTNPAETKTPVYVTVTAPDQEENPIAELMKEVKKMRHDQATLASAVAKIGAKQESILNMISNLILITKHGGKEQDPGKGRAKKQGTERGVFGGGAKYLEVDNDGWLSGNLKYQMPAMDNNELHLKKIYLEDPHTVSLDRTSSSACQFIPDATLSSKKVIKLILEEIPMSEEKRDKVWKTIAMEEDVETLRAYYRDTVKMLSKSKGKQL